MKHKIALLLLLSVSLKSFSQTLYVPSGTGGIGTSLNSGSVGIGTNVPASPLEVRGSSIRLSDANVRFLQISQDADGQPYGRGWTNSYAGGRQFKLTGWSHMPDNTGSAQKDIVHFDGYNLLLLKDNGGRVGIATTQPNAQLDIFTGTPALGSFNSQRWSTVNSTYYLTLKTIWSNDGLNYNFVQTFGGTDYSTLSFFQGSVGIGTTRPDAKLAVKGLIHAEEVKVDLNVRAPDYVFEKNYDLPTLTEVKNYINQNKHLPEVPAAKEIETNGVNLGEMNMLLLKKVEELTLYIINENQRAEKAEAKLKAELEAIKSKLN